MPLVRFDGGLLAALQRPPEPARIGWPDPVDWLAALQSSCADFRLIPSKEEGGLPAPYGGRLGNCPYTHLYTVSMPGTVIEWMGTTLDDLRAFPPEARRAAGYELRRVQAGWMPTDWKPMPSVGPGVNEIRIQTRLAHRVLYLAKAEEAIYVLHVFQKKSRKTRKADLILARQRLWQVQVLRSRRKER